MPFLDVDTIILLGDMLVAQARDFTAKYISLPPYLIT
jgi:hypothetical protein